MPRDDYNATLQSRIAKKGTRPIYLVELAFDLGGGTPLRATNYTQDILAGSITFTSNGAKVSGIADNEVSSTCSVSLRNTGKQWNAIVAAQGLGQVAKIWRSWLPDGATFNIGATDFPNVFDGVIGAAQFGPMVRFDCRSQGASKRAPALRAGPPFANWIAAPGTKIYFGGGEVTIEE